MAILIIARLTFDKYYENSPFLFFVFIVFLCSWLGGFVSGIYCILISIPLINVFFWSNDFFEINIYQAAQFLFYAVTTLIISYVTGKLAANTKVVHHINSKLIQSEDSLRNIIDSIFTLIVLVKPDGTIFEANKTFANLFDENSDSIVDKKITEIIPWQYSTEVSERLKQNIEHAKIGNQVSYDDIIKINDRKFMNVAINIVPIYKKKNKVDFLIVSATDVTDRTNYQKWLEKSQQTYSKLINSNIIGMFMASGDNNITEANEAFLNIVGFKHEDIKEDDFNLNRVTPGSFATLYNETLKELVQRGYIGPVEREFIHKDGQVIPVILSAVYIDPDSGQCMFLVVDITERKKEEQKKDEFISMASHELKTPLTTLKGYVQLLERRLQDRFQENNKFVNKMDDQLHKLNELVSDLLNVSKIHAGQLTLNKANFDLNQLLIEIIEDTQSLSPSHTIHFENPTENIFVEADRFRISQVITNFLTNAVKYSPNASNIKVYIQKEKNNAKVMVQDFGIGISEEKSKKIFEKYFRVEEERDVEHSLGLGLYISSEIIKRHEGAIGVESVIGKGSTFYFTLPLLENSTS